MNAIPERKEPETNYEKYSLSFAFAVSYGKTIKTRIWIFLHESMKESANYQELKIWNEYDFYDLCKNLIKSKKDKFKNIHNALNQLLEDGDIVKVNRTGEPWHSREDEPWYCFNFSEKFRDRTTDDMAGKKESGEDKLIRELYNKAFDKDIAPDWKHELKLVPSHFMDFNYAVHELIRIFNRPDMSLSEEEKITKGKWYPKVRLTYMPEESWGGKDISTILAERYTARHPINGDEISSETENQK